MKKKIILIFLLLANCRTIPNKECLFSKDQLEKNCKSIRLTKIEKLEVEENKSEIKQEVKN
jgi:hypothetical protein